MKKNFFYLFLTICILSIVLSFLIKMKNQNSLQEIPLKNNWIFVEKQLLVHSAEISKTSNNQVSLPFNFKHSTGNSENFGTFYTEVTLPKDYLNKNLALKIPFIYSAYTVFINDEKVTSIGMVSSNKEQQKNNLESKIIPFKTSKQQLTITIQVSSFNHMRGGIASPPTIGDWDQINDTNQTNILIITFTAGIIFVAGVLTLLIGLMNRSERALLIFGFFCLTIATRSLFTAPFIYHFFPIDISFLIATKIEYITTNLSFAFYAIFIYIQFKKYYSKRVMLSTVSILILNIVVTIFTKPLIFETLFFTLLPIKACFVFYSFFVMFKASKHGDILAKLLLFGFLVVFITMIIDHLSGIGIITLPLLSSFAIAFNVFLVILSLSQNYVKQVYDLTVLNHRLHEANVNLDEKVQQRTQMLHDANLQLTQIASYDSLTGIFNRRSFEHELIKNFDYAKEHSSHLGFIMIDLDQFKNYNDEYGHVAGDQLLVEVVNLIKSKLPNNAIFSRYGGEEFSIIIPDSDLMNTVDLSESIRKTIYSTAIPHVQSLHGVVTISVGVSELSLKSKIILKPTDLIILADNRLYYSKNNGRNQTTYK